MPTDKHAPPSSSDSQKNKYQHSADKAATIKCRRHDLYKQVSRDKREEILSQRRTIYLETKRQSHLNNSSACHSNEKASFFNAATELPRQKSLTIREPTCLNEKANSLLTAASTTVLGKGKNILGHSCIFEVGSSSAASAQQSTPVVANKGRTEQLNPEETAAKKKDDRQEKANEDAPEIFPGIPQSMLATLHLKR